MAYQFKKHFSLEEVTALLPTMAKIFEEIHTINQELNSRQSEANELKQSAKTNGGGPSSNIHLSATLRIQKLLEKVEKMGAFVKDLDRGLIDFPHLRGNREVFLCWMVGEKKIAEGKVEFKRRNEKDSKDVTVAEAIKLARQPI